MPAAYQPLHHKYRPQRFDQLVGQEAIAATLGNALRSALTTRAPHTIRAAELARALPAGATLFDWFLHEHTLGAITVFVQSAPAAYVLMLGTLFAAMFGGAITPWVIAAAVVSVFYVDRGGLRTVILTDQMQFALMYGGFAVMLGFLVVQHGGLAFLVPRVPPMHWHWHGGNGPAAILVWYVIALGTMVDPAFWQRAYAARDPQVARNGVLWSIVFWVVFDLMTTACGLYARALLPDLADPVMALPRLADVTLPPIAWGLFHLGMIATVMSTIDSYAFIAATTVGRDLLWRVRGEKAHAPGLAEQFHARVDAADVDQTPRHQLKLEKPFPVGAQGDLVVDAGGQVAEMGRRHVLVGGYLEVENIECVTRGVDGFVELTRGPDHGIGQALDLG